MRLAATVFAPVLMAAACLTLAACGDEEVPATGLPNTSAEAADDAATDADTPSAPNPDVAVALEGEGLRMVVTETGSTRPLPFGMSQDDTLAAVTNALGEPTEEGDQQECGPGPLHYVEYGQQLTLWFQDGDFAGWESQSGPISTMDGISADSSLADLTAAGVTEFNDTTLGQQFETGGLYGILDESGDAVQVLFVGVNCFAP